MPCSVARSPTFSPNGARAPAPRAPVLEVSGLTQPGIVANLNFAVGAGEIVGIAGLMGSGRSEMARILFGLDPASAGEVAVDGRVIGERSPRACMAAGMALLTEDRRGDGLLMSATILSNLTLAKMADIVPSSFSVVPEKRPRERRPRDCGRSAHQGA